MALTAGLACEGYGQMRPDPQDQALRLRLLRFTTDAYRRAALQVLLDEANRKAKNLGLNEKTPITQYDLVESFIQPPAWSVAEGMFGTLTTSNYVYTASENNKLCSITCTPTAQADCIALVEQRYGDQVAVMETNLAYTLATNWLTAGNVDVAALERECSVQITTMRHGRHYLPVFSVRWRQAAANPAGPITTRDDGYQTRAAVLLVEPDRRLLHFEVDDRYLLGPVLSVPNADELLCPSNEAPICNLRYISTAYKSAALERMLEEADWARRRLSLQDASPIKATDLKKIYIAPPLISERWKEFGTIRTGNFVYGALVGNKLSWIQQNLSTIDELHYFARIKARWLWPRNQENTNSAYTIAARWMRALNADVDALDHDCTLSVDAWEIGSQFVPLYTVTWAKIEGGSPRVIATVRLVQPDSSLNLLAVQDPHYLLREPLRAQAGPVHGALPRRPGDKETQAD